jgi:hypothetical protein
VRRAKGERPTHQDREVHHRAVAQRSCVRGARLPCYPPNSSSQQTGHQNAGRRCCRSSRCSTARAGRPTAGRTPHSARAVLSRARLQVTVERSAGRDKMAVADTSGAH